MNLAVTRLAQKAHATSSMATVCLVAGLLLGGAGCNRDDVSHFRVPKEQQQALATPAGMSAPPPGMAGDVPPPPALEGGALSWKLPSGWTEAKGGGAMRYATLKPSVPGKAEVTVIVLPGPAGGELANVNRWRNQIGLAPLDEAGLAPLRKRLRSPAGEVALYDFTSEGDRRSRTVAGFAVVDGNSWFVKLSGDAEPVAAARPAFLELLGSLHRD